MMDDNHSMRSMIRPSSSLPDLATNLKAEESWEASSFSAKETNPESTRIVFSPSLPDTEGIGDTASDISVSDENDFRHDCSKTSSKDDTITPSLPPSTHQLSQSGNSTSSSCTDFSEENHYLHSLNDFFTPHEKSMLENPDAVLSIKGNYFIVLPNEYQEGETLFRSVSQALLKNEQRHSGVRDEVLNFITSEAGWTALGHHIIPYYENFFSEMKKGHQYFGLRQLDFFKRVYRHNLENRIVDGSLIELVAASINYGFRYTCIIQQAEGEASLIKKPEGKARFRVVNSFVPEDGDETTHHFFMRVGDSPSNWVWSLLLPYMSKSNEIEINIPRGNYIAEQWNVLGFNWNREAVKRIPSNFFYWRQGITVISTTSGKFLGGYTSLEPDLYTNLCWLMDGNFRNYHALRDTISKHSKTKDPMSRFVWHPSQLDVFVGKESRTEAISSQLQNPPNETSVIGTVQDLMKAAKLYNFRYIVIEVNEHGDLHTMVKSTYPSVDKEILHFLVRTRKGIVTRWCALQDMKQFDDWNRFKDDEGQGDRIIVKPNYPAGSRRFITKRNRNIKSKTGIVSKYFGRIRSLLKRISKRNKVQEDKSGGS